MNKNVFYSRRFKLVICFVLLILASAIFSNDIRAQENIRFSASMETVLALDDDELLDDLLLNLYMRRNFGFDADLYIDLEFHSYHSRYELDKDFYLKELSRLERVSSVDINEAYLNYYSENIDWKIGRQIVNWGSAFLFSPGNYFNPENLSTLSTEPKKIAVESLKGRYYHPERNLEVSGVLSPFFNTNKLKAENEYTLVNSIKESSIESTGERIFGFLKENSLINEQLNLNQDISVAEITDVFTPIIHRERVENSLDNLQGGLLIKGRQINGFDLSFSLYRGRDHTPILDRDYMQEQVKAFVKEYSLYIQKQMEAGLPLLDFNEYYDQEKIYLELIYPENNRLGFDMIASIGDTGVWAEASYSIYDQQQFDNQLKAVVGFDRRMGNNIYILGQYYYQQGRIEQEEDLKLLNLHLNRPLLQFHEIEMNILYNISQESYSLMPSFKYSLTDSTSLNFTVTYTDNEKAWGMLPVTNRFSSALSVAF